MEQAEENDKYNFAVGPFRFAVALGFGVEFNDNINLADHNRESDIILRPNLDFQATWRLSELNTLHINLGISYAEYLHHTELNSRAPLISPNSDVAFTFFTGAVQWTMRDRISYQEDPYDIAVLSNTAVYRRWENQAGLEADWKMNDKVDLKAGYDHYNLWTVGNDPVFKLQDRSMDTFFIKPAFRVNPAIKVGLNASYSIIQFSSSERSDGNGVLVGPFIEWQLSDVTNMHLEAGYQQLKFNGTSDFSEAEIAEMGLSPAEAAQVRGILQDNSSSDNYYVKFEIDNKPSDSFSHRLSFTKTAEIGFDSNYYNLYHVEYNANWKCLPHVELGPTVFYEHYDTSGEASQRGYRIGAALGIRYHVTNSLTVGLDYRYLLNNTNVPDSDYYQNLVFLSAYYKF